MDGQWRLHNIIFNIENIELRKTSVLSLQSEKNIFLCVVYTFCLHDAG